MKTKDRLKDIWFWISGEKSMPTEEHYANLRKEFRAVRIRKAEIEREFINRERYMAAHKAILDNHK